MLQVKPSILGAARLRSHPLQSEGFAIPASVTLEMMRLHHGIVAGMSEPGGVVQFTGAVAKVGTTRTVTTLAEVLARSGVAVGSVDLQDMPQVSATPVSADGFAGSVTTGDGAGRSLTPADVMDHVSQGARFDLVLIDTPPIVDSVLSMSIAPAVKGTVVVMQAERTTDAQVREAIERIVDCGGRCLGIVFNKRRGRASGSGRR